MGLVIAVLLARDLVALPLGTVGTDLFQGEQVGARLHDASRQEEGRHVEAGYGHEVGRHGFIATGDECFDEALFGGASRPIRVLRLEFNKCDTPESDIAEL